MFWTLSGEGFLTAYGLAAGVALLFALWWRWQFSAGANADVPGELVELAYLVGGSALACYACLAALRQAGLVKSGHMSTVAAVGSLPRGTAPLTGPLMAALHQAMRTPRTWLDVRSDLEVRRVLNRMDRRLLRRGWLMSRADQWWYRCGVLGLLLVAGGGVTRLVAGLQGRVDPGSPGATVGLLLAVAGTVLAAWLLGEAPVVTRAGRRAVKRARQEYAHLAPGRPIGQEARDPKTLMTSVALFGPHALLATDPSFTVQVGFVPEPRPGFVVEKPKKSLAAALMSKG